MQPQNTSTMCNPNLKTLAKLFSKIFVIGNTDYRTSSIFAITTKRLLAKMYSSYMARGIDVKSTCYLDASAKRDLSYFSRPSILWKVCLRKGGIGGKNYPGETFYVGDLRSQEKSQFLKNDH